MSVALEIPPPKRTHDLTQRLRQSADTRVGAQDAQGPRYVEAGVAQPDILPIYNAGDSAPSVITFSRW